MIIPGLVLALVAGAAGFLSTPPSYSQSQSYLLLSPVVTEQGRGNPFLQLGNGVGMAASVLSKRVSDGETAQAITASEPGLEYAVVLDPTTSAPILVVTAQAPSPTVVASALERLEGELSAQLAALQKAAGAPEVSWVTISLLTRDVGAQASYSASMRTGVVAAVGALLLLLLLLLLLAGLETQRIRAARKASAPGTSSADDALLPAPVPAAPTDGPVSGFDGPPSSRPLSVSAAGSPPRER
jgi:hypothetical protein